MHDFRNGFQEGDLTQSNSRNPPQPLGYPLLEGDNVPQAVHYLIPTEGIIAFDRESVTTDSRENR